MKEVNPQTTTRAYAFEMWMNAPMPMVTFFHFESHVHLNFLDEIARFHRNRRYILANDKGLLEKSLWVHLFHSGSVACVL